jgi:nicotinamidase-related amidase
MPDVLVIIDMQAGSFGPESPPRHDATALFERLNRLARWVRANDGVVIWVQHDGPLGGPLEPGSEGWRVMSPLERLPNDVAISKTACDSFLGTDLEAVLRRRGAGRVIITGWATDFCVDTTVRSSTGRGFDTWVPSDGHAVSDRPHLSAAKVIEHHNYVWSELIAPGGAVTVLPCEDLISGLAYRS